MLIVHGDYKDLNYTGNFEAIPPFYDEIPLLLPVWERFLDGHLSLTGFVSKKDWYRYTWIDIQNYVLPRYAYTSYGIIPAERIRPLGHWNSYDHRFADHNAQIVITETLMSYNNRDLSFDELKHKQLDYARMKMDKNMKEHWENKRASKWYWQELKKRR